MKNKISLLIVDDSKSILSLLSNAFISKGYDVKMFTDPLKAYETIESQHVDIVISDIEMPQMNGLELLKKIKDFNNMIQVIIMTSYTTVNNTLNTFRYGAFDMLFKPFDPAEMVELVDSAVARLDRVQDLVNQAMVRKGQ